MAKENTDLIGGENMFSTEWWKAALIRAVRTFAESALAFIGTNAVLLGDVNWIGVLSAGGFGFVTSMLLAMTGLPEVTKKQPPDVE
jgi:hypothetical protein